MELISTYTVASSRTSFSFTNIPQTYKTLYVIGDFSMDFPNQATGEVNMRINNISSSNYAFTDWSWQNNSQNVAGVTTFNHFRFSYTPNNIGAEFRQQGRLLIPNYAGSNPKKFLISAGYNAGSNNQDHVMEGLVQAPTSSAVTSIQFIGQISNNHRFRAGTTVSLYGLG